MCSFLLDKTFQETLCFTLELEEIFLALFQRESANNSLNNARVNKLCAFLENLVQSDELDEANWASNIGPDQMRKQINIRHHRIIYLINCMNSGRSNALLKALSVKLAFFCLEDIFVIFSNEKHVKLAESKQVRGNKQQKVLFRVKFQ
jgi:hypothetical protein